MRKVLRKVIISLIRRIIEILIRYLYTEIYTRKSYTRSGLKLLYMNLELSDLSK